MTYSGLRTRIAAFACTLLLAATAMTATSNTASAQVGCCPTYAVTIQPSLPATCYPIRVDTRWSNGLTGTSTHTAPGTIIVTAPNPPGCWLSPLTGLAINGVGIPLPAIIPPCIGPINIGGCSYTICFLRSASGCWAIDIR